MNYNEILLKRNEIRNKITLLNCCRWDNTSNVDLNNSLKELKEKYNFYNNLLKNMCKN